MEYFDFVMKILKKRNAKSKKNTYMSLVEYGVACWDPYRKNQIKSLERVQKLYREDLGMEAKK